MDEQYQWAIHFGLYPNIQGIAEIAGHRDASVEKEVVLPAHLEMDGTLAVISGSWKCWGEADQDTDGDHSLHLVVRTNALGTSDKDGDLAYLDRVFTALVTSTAAHGRWLDYAILSEDADWSEQHYVALFKGSTPQILRYIPTTGPVVLG